jgi:3-oxoacyl-[acyl-carrier protein] reductase
MRDRVAIITGAAQGLGLEIAREFARRGAISILTDINQAKLLIASKSVAAIDPRARHFTLDVTQKNQWLETTASVHHQFGSVDILVNNAALIMATSFDEVSEAEWDQTFAVNVKGTLLGCQVVAPYMRSQKWGRIVNISSQAGKTGGLVLGPHYPASKAAVICLTKSIAASLAPDNVTVNAVAPGIINTDIINELPGVKNCFSRIPLGEKPGEPIDVAKAVAFLASEDARYITGEILDVNGGLLMD